MPECPDETAAITIRNQGYGGISGGPANGNDCQKFASRVAGRARSGEDQARRKRERYSGGCNKCPRAPILKELQHRGHFTVSKFTVQICRSGLLCQSECKDSANNRARCGHCRVLIPGVTVSGRENSGQDVGASKRRQRRAVKDCQKEKPQCTQVPEYRGETTPTTRTCALDQQVQHHCHVNTRPATDSPNPRSIPRRKTNPSTNPRKNPAINPAAAGLSFRPAHARFRDGIRRSPSHKRGPHPPVFHEVRNAFETRCVSWRKEFKYAMACSAVCPGRDG